MRRLSVAIALVSGLILLAPGVVATDFHTSQYGVGKGTVKVSQFNPSSALQRDCNVATPVALEFYYDPTWYGDGVLVLTMPTAAACFGDGTNGVVFDSCWVGGGDVSCTMSWDACYAPTTCWGQIELGSDGWFSGQGYSYTEVYDQDGNYDHSTGYSYEVRGKVALVADPMSSVLAADLDCAVCAPVEALLAEPLPSVTLPSIL